MKPMKILGLYKKLLSLVLLFLILCCCCNTKTKSLVDELYSNPIDKNKNPMEVYDALYDNEVSINDVSMNEYSYEELYNYFSVTKADENYLSFVFHEERLMHCVNEKFPIRILRKVPDDRFNDVDPRSRFYTVYKVREGGYFYVFFVVRDNKYEDFINDYAYVTFPYYFDGNYADVEKLARLKENENTWQDVYEIDKNMETWHSGQSAVNTESIIADEETKELKGIWIGYELAPDSLEYDEDGRFSFERSDYYIEYIAPAKVIAPDDLYCIPIKIFDFDLPENTLEWAKKYYLHLNG